MEDEWDDVALVGSVCDVALAELVVDAASLEDTPDEVVASWGPLGKPIPLKEASEEVEPPAYSVVEITPDELAIMQLASDPAMLDAEAAAAGEDGLYPQEASEASASASPRKGSASPGGGSRKEGGRQYGSSRAPKRQPFVRGQSQGGAKGAFSRAGLPVAPQRRTRASTHRAMDRNKTSKLPAVRRSLTDILHKQPRILPRPRRKPKSSYGRVPRRSLALAPKRRGVKQLPRRVAVQVIPQPQADVQAVMAPQGDAPLEGHIVTDISFGQLELTDADRSILANLAARHQKAAAAVAGTAAATGATAPQLPTECEGMRLMVGPDGEPLHLVAEGVTEEMLIAELAELDAMRLALSEAGSRSAGVDGAAAAAALAAMQQRAMARLDAAAKLEQRMRQAQAEVEASASEVRRALDEGGGWLEGANAAMLRPFKTLVDIGLEHGAIEKAVGEISVRRGAGGSGGDGDGDGDQVSGASSSGGQPAFSNNEEGGGTSSDGRQQRSRHMSEQLLRLQEESRRLQKHSTQLTERAMEMQRAAGILVMEPAAAAAAGQEAEGGDCMHQHPVGQDSAHGDAGAQDDQQRAMSAQDGDAMPAMGSVAARSVASADKGAGIAWTMPARNQPIQNLGRGLSPNTVAKPVKKGVTMNAGYSPQRPEPQTSGQTSHVSGTGRQHARVGSADSMVDNMPMLPRWSDLVSSPLTSPLKIVRKPPRALGGGGGGAATASHEMMPQPPATVQRGSQAADLQQQQQQKQHSQVRHGDGASGSEAWAAGLVLQHQHKHKHQQHGRGPLSPRQMQQPLQQQNWIPEDASVKFPRRFLPTIDFSVAKRLAPPPPPHAHAPAPPQYAPQQYGPQGYGAQEYRGPDHFQQQQRQQPAIVNYMMHRMIPGGPSGYPLPYPSQNWQGLPHHGPAVGPLPPEAASASPSAGPLPAALAPAAKRGAVSARHPGKAGPALGKLAKSSPLKQHQHQHQHQYQNQNQNQNRQYRPEEGIMAGSMPPYGGMMSLPGMVLPPGIMPYTGYDPAWPPGAPLPAYGQVFMGMNAGMPMFGGSNNPTGMHYPGMGMGRMPPPPPPLVPQGMMPGHELPWGMPPVAPLSNSLVHATTAERAAEVQQQLEQHYRGLQGAVEGRIDRQQQAGQAAVGRGGVRRQNLGAGEPASEGSGRRPSFRLF